MITFCQRVLPVRVPLIASASTTCRDHVEAEAGSARCSPRCTLLAACQRWPARIRSSPSLCCFNLANSTRQLLLTPWRWASLATSWPDLPSRLLCVSSLTSGPSPLGHGQPVGGTGSAGSHSDSVVDNAVKGQVECVYQTPGISRCLVFWAYSWYPSSSSNKVSSSSLVRMRKRIDIIKQGINANSVPRIKGIRMNPITAAR